MTPCPNCSATAVGTDLVSACTECLGVSVAGATFSVPTMLLTAAAAVALGVMWKHLAGSWRAALRPSAA